jgi:hypothetical protein
MNEAGVRFPDAVQRAVVRCTWESTLPMQL